MTEPTNDNGRDDGIPPRALDRLIVSAATARITKRPTAAEVKKLNEDRVE